MPSSDSSDDIDYDALVRRTLAGDLSGFEAIVRRLERPLRAWLATHVSPGVDVDEIAQRSFVIAHSKLDRFQLGTNFSAWVFAIARFQLKAELTRLRRIADYHARFAPDLLQRELERRADEPGDARKEQLDCLKACVESLGDNLRRYVRWRYEEEVPLETMAERTGRSVGAIKKQLWLIRRKLQECVEARMKTEGAES